MRKTCARCGRMFETKTPAQRYCGKKCAAVRRRYAAQCRICGKRFEAGSFGCRYCSDECRALACERRNGKTRELTDRMPDEKYRIMDQFLIRRAPGRQVPVTGGAADE